MSLVRRCGSSAVRWRYPILIVAALLGAAVGRHIRAKGLSDWLWFEFGARTLIHLNSHYSSGALSLYAHYPLVQIGPPPLLAVSAFQWLPPHTTEILFVVLLAFAGVWCLRCVELAVATVRPLEDARRLAASTLAAGLIVVPVWGLMAGQWIHLDDVMAITFTMTAIVVMARRPQWWWLAAALVGTAIAAKPWAVVIAPCLLMLPRVDRARAGLVMIVAAGAWWAPFILGDSQTAHALGGFQYPVDSNSTVHSLGVALGSAPRWVRPVQFLGGALLTTLAVRKRTWLAVPFLAFAFRVTIDPQTWLYYGIGPLAGAALWDVSRRRGWPVWTLVTVVVQYVVPSFTITWMGPIRLLWFLAIVVEVFRPDPSAAPEGLPEAADHPEPRVAALTT